MGDRFWLYLLSCTLPSFIAFFLERFTVIFEFCRRRQNGGQKCAEDKATNYDMPGYGSQHSTESVEDLLAENHRLRTEIEKLQRKNIHLS